MNLFNYADEIKNNPEDVVNIALADKNRNLTAKQAKNEQNYAEVEIASLEKRLKELKESIEIGLDEYADEYKELHQKIEDIRNGKISVLPEDAKVEVEIITNSEIEKELTRKIFFSENFNQEFSLYPDLEKIIFSDGVQYSFDEINNLGVAKLDFQDLKTQHELKKNFGLQYCELY